MHNQKPKHAWTTPVLEAIELTSTASKTLAPNEGNTTCSGPANSTSPRGCGS